MKKHDLHRAVIGCNEYPYFYQREKNDINGNARFRVFITDPDGPAVHETIIKCYEKQLPEYVEMFIENTIGITIPF